MNPDPHSQHETERTTRESVATKLGSSSFLSPRRTLHPKPEISDHELLRCIGYGSYGEVWLARNIMGVFRAVKVVYRDTFESDKPYDREFEGIKKFEPVSRAHESQVAILHIGRNDEAGYFYYVMELADDAGDQEPSGDDGATVDVDSYQPKTLRSELLDHRIPMQACLELALRLTTALQHLHSHGLVHRDIKPSNIIIVNGRPKLADIGLVAKADMTLSFVGTEGFVPPEGPGQPQADIYGLGKSLYEVATGKDRTQFPDPPTTFDDNGSESHGLFLELNEILLKACDADVNRRYATAEAMHEDLLLLQAGKSVRRARMVEARLATLTKLAVVFVILSVLVAGAYYYQQAQTERARQLADENRKLADREKMQREIAEKSTAEAREAERHFELGSIEQLLEIGETGRALASLARRLRAHPEDTLTARRLLGVLSYRDFALPLAQFEQPEDASIRGADLSPDGRYLAVFTIIKKSDPIEKLWELSLWNVDTAKLVAREPIAGFQNYGGGRFTRIMVRFNRDGSRLVVPGGEHMAATIWEVDEGLTLLQEIERPEGAGYHWHAEFGPDSERIVTMTTKGKAFILDTRTGRRLVTLDAAPYNWATLMLCRFTPGGERVMTSVGQRSISEEPGNISVWDSRSGALVNRLDDDRFTTDAVVLWKGQHIALDPRGPRLVYVRSDGWLKIWNYETGALVTAPEKHEKPIHSVAFSPDGRLVASGGDDERIRIWEAGDGQLKLRHRLSHSGEVVSVVFSPDGAWLASSSSSVTALWDVRTGQPVRDPFPTAGVVSYFAAEGRRLISLTGYSSVRGIRSWDLRSGAARPTVLVDEQGIESPRLVRDVRYSPDGTRIVSSKGFEDERPFFRDRILVKGRDERTIRAVWSEGAYVFDEGGERPLGESRVWMAPTAEPVGKPLETIHCHTAVAVTPDGTRAVGPIEDGLVIWDPQSGVERQRILGVGYDPRFLAISPDGKWAYTHGHEGVPNVWNLETGQLQWPPDSSGEGPLIAAAFSPDSEHLVTVRRTWTQDIPPLGLIRKVETGETVATLEDVYAQWHQSWIEGRACWSPVGRLIAFAHGGGFRLHDAVSGHPLGDRPVQLGNPITSTGFSSDGHYYLTAFDRSTRIWEVPDLRQVVRDLRHEGAITAATFSRDTRMVATASRDKSAKVWDRASGFIVADPFLHPDEVLAVDFHPEGNWLATGCADGVARLWELPQASGPAPDWLPELAETVGGYHLTEVGSLERIGRGTLALKQRLTGEGEDADDAYVHWARWFFADRDRRPISPSAEITMESYREHLPPDLD